MAAKTTMTGFVGRADELATLRASVVEGAGGRPTTVLVGGDAGVGKSRLLAELAADPRLPDALLLFGHCVDVGDGELPYAPILGALRTLAAALDRDELEQVLGPGKRELARLLPDLGISEAIAPAPGEPHGQARLFELLLGALGRLSARRPVVLVIEDLHWADRSTRDLLRFLVRSATAERLAIVASYRTDELHRRHPLRPFLAELERDQHVRRLVVAPFRREELADLVAQVSGAPPDGATLDELYERTEGNPFFAEELLAASAIASELPESLLDALLVRIERLSARAQRVVRAAAAAGRRVDHRLLAAVAGVPESELLEILREAVAARVLVADQREGAYEFRHALLREAAYEDLLPGERESLHLALARALEGRPDLAGAGATLAAELAYHWHAGHEPALAVLASIEAAEEAERLFAHAEALRHLERAVELWGFAPAEARDAVDEATLLHRAAAAAGRAGLDERSIALAGRALGLLDDESDAQRSSAVRLLLARAHMSAGRGADAQPYLAKVLDLRPAEATPEHAAALAMSAQVAQLSGDMPAALARAEEALAAARAVGAAEAEASALATLTGALALCGRLDEAVSTAHEAVRVARRAATLDQLGRSYINGSEALDEAGRVADAVELCREGLREAQALGVERQWGMFLRAELATRLTKLGRFEDAEETIQDGLRAGAAGMPRRLLLEAQASLAARRGDEATAVAALAGTDGSVQPGGGLWHLPVTAATALLRLSQGDAAAAARVVDQALPGDGGELLFYLAPVCALGARAHVELSLRARALRREGDAAAARRAAERLAARLDAELHGEEPAPEALAWRAQLGAELGRLDGDPPERWARAREQWERLAFPFEATTCAWREADAILGRGGDRAAAAALLTRARATAAALPARWLLEEIEALGRRARLEIETSAGDRPDAPDEIADETGLTPRELEVLRLLADGRTNRQIAEALFMSQKTASVHVSRILAKLHAANRGEAAATGRRLGVL